MMLISLSEGLSGAPDRLHGGFTATALDMICSYAINGSQKPAPISTATLNVEYKAPIVVPQVVVAKGWVVKTEGRKQYTRGTIEDSEGKVFARGTALFIELKPNI